MTTRRSPWWSALAIVAILSGPAFADPTPAVGDAPPKALISGTPAKGAALDPVFKQFVVERLSCKFSEEKKIALLARPLKSTGTIYFDREKGIARTVITPKPQQVVLTRTTLKIRTAKKTEEIPLDKSKDLKAFALIFPTLLRGERAELEKSFEIGLYGSDKDWWALSFSPKTKSLEKMVKRVVVYGKKTEAFSLQIVEANGDTTDTRLTDIVRDKAVPDSEIATAFGAP